MNFVPTTTYVKRIPATLPATRQVLDDAAVLEDVLTNRLLFMVKRRLEDQMIAGNGTLGAPDPGANLTGILSTPGVLTVTKATFNSFLQPQLDSISAAIEAIQAATYTFYSPNVLLLHPSDALQLRDLQDHRGKARLPAERAFDPWRPGDDHHLGRGARHADPWARPRRSADSCAATSLGCRLAISCRPVREERGTAVRRVARRVRRPAAAGLVSQSRASTRKPARRARRPRRGAQEPPARVCIVPSHRGAGAPA